MTDSSAAKSGEEQAIHIAELEAANAELTRKGEGLCQQNGNLLIEQHDLKKRIAKLNAAINDTASVLPECYVSMCENPDDADLLEPTLVEKAEYAVKRIAELEAEIAELVR